jgi:PAS domain S-box-containing protein
MAIGRRIGLVEGLPELFELVSSQLVSLVGSGDVFIVFAGQDRAQGDGKLGVVRDGRRGVRSEDCSPEATICRWVLESGRPLLFEDLAEEDQVLRLLGIRASGAGLLTYRSLAVVPVNSQGSPVAVLGLSDNSPGKFSSGDLALLTTIGSLVGPAVQTLLVQEKVESELKKRLDELLLLQGKMDREKQDLAAILQSTPDMIVTLDGEKRILSWNPAAASALGWPEDEIRGASCAAVLQCSDAGGRPICEHDCRVDYCLRNNLPAVGGRRQYVKTRDGRAIPVESSLAVTREQEGRATKSVYVLRDVSAVARREQGQQAIVQMFRQLTNDLSSLYRLNRAGAATLKLPDLLQVTTEGAAKVLELSHSAVLLFSADGRSLVVEAAYTLEGPPLFWVGDRLNRPEAPELFDLLSAKVEAAQVNEVPGSKLLASSLFVPISDGGEVLGLLALAETRGERQYVSRDRRLAKRIANQAASAIRNARLYERVQQDLESKSALVQEMHHRIKNGLQMVAGLLRLETLQKDASGPVKEALERSIARIDSVADVHDLLSYAGDEYVGSQDLIERIVKTVTAEIAPSEGIQVFTHGTEVELPCKEAISLGLVINELVCNALQHAFEGRHKGEVRVDLVAEDGILRLEVDDDGVGLPADFQISSSSHLGLQIVQKLSERDLRGSFKLENTSNGTSAVVTFPRTVSSLR